MTLNLMTLRCLPRLFAVIAAVARSAHRVVRGISNRNFASIAPYTIEEAYGGGGCNRACAGLADWKSELVRSAVAGRLSRADGAGKQGQFRLASITARVSDKNGRRGIRMSLR